MASSTVAFAPEVKGSRVVKKTNFDLAVTSGVGDAPQTLKLNRTFDSETVNGKSASLPRDDTKPLKGILVHQSSKSHDTTPISSPRSIPDNIASSSSQNSSQSARTLPASSSASSTGKHKSSSSSSNTVSDFLKKFSPKLNRSKKSLQWYTVDIQPSNQNGVPRKNSAEIENDPTIRSLQNGSISSEFSAEMSECLSKNLSVNGVKSGTVNGVSSTLPLKSSSSGKNTDRVDFVRSSVNSAGIVGIAPSYDRPANGLGLSKSVPNTPVAGGQSLWKAMMVDIDLDKENPVRNLRQEFFKAEMQASAGKHVGFNLPPYNLQNQPSVMKPLDNFRDHVPSYIKLSRALNGYSQRNMYTSRKLVNNRDYNSLLCKSEEYLNRSSSAAPSSARGRSTETAGGTDTSKDYRRAASADRDLSARRVVYDVDISPKEDEKKPAEDIGSPKDTKVDVLKPGHDFLKKLDEEVESLKELCAKGEAELSENLPEEALDQLRTAIGKTNLLLSQKFEQFRGLCRKNIDENGEEQFRTTVSDLQGFWDMMFIQVSDVRRMFSEVEKLKSGESSQLQGTTALDGKGASVSGSSESPKLTGTPNSGRRSSKPKVTFQLNNERDQQRKELIAAKRKAFEELQQKQQQNGSPSKSGALNGSEEVQIFLPAAEVK